MRPCPKALLWAAVAGFRMLQSDSPLIFVPAFLSAMFYLAVVGQALLVNPEKDVETVL